MMLRPGPGGTLTLLDGVTPFNPFGYYQCCTASPLGETYNDRWPLIDTGLMDYAAQYGANWFGFRMGPFYGDARHEPAWREEGGGYVDGPGSAFNDAFFAKAESIVAYAASQHWYVEINVVDTWYCKVARQDPGQMPWTLTAIRSCGVEPNTEVEAWIRHVVQVFNKYPNVVWLLDNEGANVPGASQRWWVWAAGVIRDEEQKEASKKVHLMGASLDFSPGVTDYAVTHENAGVTKPFNGQFLLNNERAYQHGPDVEAKRFEVARAASQGYAFWAGDMSVADQTTTLGLFKAVVSGTQPTPPPPGGEWTTVFPVPFPVESAVCYMRNARYGNGVDSTLRCRGDRALCEMIHHVSVPSADCHFDSDVWTAEGMRADYEGFVLNGARAGKPLPDRPLGPVWQYRAQGQYGRCHDDREGPNTSCDHFGDTVNRDDPQTPRAFEGKPSWLVYQSDSFGPYSGFFMVPQTSGASFGTQVRACLPGVGEGDDATCAPWLSVDWR